MKGNDMERPNKRMLRAILPVAGPLLALLLAALPVASYAQGQPQSDKIADTGGLSGDKSWTGADSSKITLSGAIEYALKNNPRMRMAGKDIDMEMYGIDSAKADRMPRIDFGGGINRYLYDMPLTPVVIQPPITAATEFPLFRRTVWDTGVTFKLPLFRGGRLVRGVNVAEMKKAVAQDNYRMNRQELVYNISSVFYKIAQLEKLFLANDASVKQLEEHKRNVEVYLETGSVPRLDLLKTDVELSHAIENRLVVKNSLASTYELLKTLMGMDDMTVEISIIPEETMSQLRTTLEESMSMAISQRPDYKAVVKKRLISEEKVKIAEGKRLPDVFAAGQYGGMAGTDTQLKENWYYGVRLTMPIFDGGLIRAEINKERVELAKVREEERSLKLSITREVRDGHLSIANAQERIDVTQKAIESAREGLRVERLKYDTGAGTSQEVIDAQTALLRAEADYHQAIFDRKTALAYLKKAVGEEEYDIVNTSKSRE